MASFRGALPVRLVIVGTLVIKVPFITLFLFHALSFPTPVFDPTTSISVLDDITQVTVVPTTPSTVLPWWSDAAGRVLMGTPLAVKLMTPVSILVVVDRIYHCCCVQHRLEALDMRVDFFIILW
jgi:hypothetical protein